MTAQQTVAERRNVAIGVLAALGYAIPGLQLSTTADLEAELAYCQGRSGLTPAPLGIGVDGGYEIDLSL